MTFILRQVAKRASGGEIVRTRDIGDGPVRIGRGADCDIRIPDLAVSLHHATLSSEGLGRVRVDAAGEQPFGVDGRFTRAASIKAETGAVLTFGDHQLTISSDDAGQITLGLTEAAAASGQRETTSSADLIPPSRLLGKRRLAWAGFVLIGLICLVAPVLALNGVFGSGGHPRIDLDSQWSSGPLSKSHAFLENDCQACHQKAFVAVRDESCRSCHAAAMPAEALKQTVSRVKQAGSPDAPSLVGDHAPPLRLLWGAPQKDGWAARVVLTARKVFNKPEQRCVSCHTEHVGDPLTDPARSKPTQLTPNTCVSCHTGLSSRLKDTRIVDTPSWTKHPELRPEIVVSPEPLKVRRISMASKPTENTGLIFPHDMHLNPVGGPARMAERLGLQRGYGAPLTCSSCHTPKPNADNYLPVNMEKACSACHSLNVATGGGVRALPHGDPRKLVSFFQGGGGPVVATGPGAGARRRPGETDTYRGVSASAAQRMRGLFAQGGACYGCHAATPADGAAAPYKVGPVYLPDRYLTTGSFNHRIKAHREGPDGKESCADCHAAAKSGSARDVLEPTLSVCASCHGKDKDKDRAPQAAGADCADCHSYHTPQRRAPRPDDDTHRKAAKTLAARERPSAWGAGG
jgi:predicted CXXCH cytochrome family protein